MDSCSDADPNECFYERITLVDLVVRSSLLQHVVNLLRLVIMFNVLIVSKYNDTNPLFSSGKVHILQL